VAQVGECLPSLASRCKALRNLSNTKRKKKKTPFPKLLYIISHLILCFDILYISLIYFINLCFLSVFPVNILAQTSTLSFGLLQQPLNWFICIHSGLLIIHAFYLNKHTRW
jgi:hypothetical protein